MQTLSFRPDVSNQRHRVTEMPINAYNKTLSQIEKARDEDATSLVISEMHLTELPPEIGKLTALTSLIIEDNPLTAIPTEIGQLSNLEVFSVSNSRLTYLPAEIGKLSALIFLDLNSNQLTSLPEEMSQLIELQWLYLSNNKLKTLPRWITGMIMEIGWEDKLEVGGIDISGNPLEDPPIEIVKQGNAAIKQYFEAKVKEKPRE